MNKLYINYSPSSIIEDNGSTDLKFLGIKSTENRKLKVLIYSDYPYNDLDFQRGGIINAVYWLVQGLSRINAMELFVLTPCKHIKEKITKSIGNTTVIYHPLYNRGYDPLTLYRGSIRSLSEEISKIKPDIVHAQHLPDHIYAAIKSKIPHVITIHGVFKNEYEVAKYRFNIRDRIKKVIAQNTEIYYLKKIKNLIAITEEIEHLARNNNPKTQIYRINNAIDDNYFDIIDKSNSNKPIILFVAAITYRKGLHYLIEAVELLKKYVPNVQLRIAGMADWDSEYVQMIKKKWAESIDSGLICFLGGISQERLYEEFSICSVFSLPSLAESAPMVIAQASASGKPVVATRIGGIPNMINNGVNGYLVEPENVNDLFAALKNIFVDESHRIELGMHARSSAKEMYSTNAIANATFNAYTDILRREK